MGSEATALLKGRMVCVCGEHLPAPSHSDVVCRCGLRYPRPVVDLRALRDDVRNLLEGARKRDETIAELEERLAALEAGDDEPEGG